MTATDALEKIYASLQNDNEGIDAIIEETKAAGIKTLEVEPARLPHNNREGRKMMQAYFRKRGIAVTFKA